MEQNVILFRTSVFTVPLNCCFSAPLGILKWGNAKIGDKGMMFPCILQQFNHWGYGTTLVVSFLPVFTVYKHTVLQL